MISGRYDVVRALGQGSSGRTMLCFDREAGRQVAIKELRYDRIDAWKHLELFEREASVLARLEHPGVPRVFDYFKGDEGSGAVYIVQEFIEGSSLKSRIDSGPMLGQGELVELADSLFQVLDYLHDRAPPVLHRDIEPSNILIRQDGSVVLVDFGGVLLGWHIAGSEGATVVGTFGYMPPEQLLGQAGPTSDLYAVGATLLHALTGRAPTEFSYETGRLEVPTSLPRTPLVKLIDALLRPAPRDRPRSAQAARELLSGPPAPAAAADRSGTAVARREPTGRVITVVSDNGPNFVEMGSPPRDPKGEFSDVYRNLMNPLFPAKRLWSMGVHLFWVSLATFGAVGTAGIFPLIYANSIRKRRKRYGDLFRHGHATRGVIRSAKAEAVYAKFKYEFEVEGTVYLAFMDYATEMSQFWGDGDHVPVLYDPDDPRRSCFVYR
ncbi:MAG: serine/threonine protein kinase [Gemmatimonadetes bacterium]|nr:serine/threonine protein kinase [Gemmatimonadota bacterium]